MNPDPVTREIIRSTLVAITDEMKTNLMRTAYNLIIYEALDFTVGLFDAAGNTISIGLGLPMFIRGLSDTVRAKLKHWGVAGIKPGDILLTNDSYIMGSHLNHMVFSLPIFFDGELVAFASTMAHWQDIGGVLSGVTTDIYAEGLQMPMVKIFKEGEPDEELMAIIRANVRFPDLALGDLRAQIAAIKTGEKRVVELMRRYGADTVLRSIETIMDASEALARREVSLMPDGVYEATSFMDDDGVHLGRRIPIHVRVTIAGDRMTVDLSEVSRQVTGYYNSGETAGRSAAQVAFKCLTSPLVMPINEGQFRPLDVILPPGRVVSALKPAPVRWWMTIPMTIVDTIFRALAPAVPDRVAAGHHADLMVAQLHGIDPRTGRFYFCLTGLIGGGWGATATSDGQCATVCINDGDTHNTTVEATENRFPITVERYELITDSGGAGTFRGGLGAEQVIRMSGAASIESFIERTQCAPWGLFGGGDARPNAIGLEQGGRREAPRPNGKIPPTRLEPGDGHSLRSGGGGGVGDPLERPVELVRRDVEYGYVSAQSARDDYGVVLDATTFTVDEPATAALRDERRRTPVAP
jgi:N-methylhydantoinase B